MAAKGCHAVTFSENPEKLGYPSLHSDHWDPFWQACSDEGTVVCLHIGSSSQVVDHRDRRAGRRADHAAADEHRAGCGRPPVVAGAAEVPGPHVALSEGGIGWIPYFLERVDRVYDRRTTSGRTRTSATSCPSEVFHERIVTCFIDDTFGVEARKASEHRPDHVGVRLPALRLDRGRPLRNRSRIYLDGVPDEKSAKITHENAMRIFSFDPFSHVPREQATVAASAPRRPMSTSASGRRSPQEGRDVTGHRARPRLGVAEVADRLGLTFSATPAPRATPTRGRSCGPRRVQRGERDRPA